MQATDSAVRREIIVKTTPERAFGVFTEQFDSWWPRSHHIAPADMARAVIDTQQGQWYEVGVDGSRCDWGAVLAYEPPHRLLLEWRIGGRWGLETDPDAVSEIEVIFTPEGDATREHRNLDRHTAAEALREAVGGEGGWPGLLQRYSEVVAAD